MIQVAVLVALSIAALKPKYQVVFALVAPVTVLGDSRITPAKIIYLLILIFLNFISSTDNTDDSIANILIKIKRINFMVMILLIQLLILGIYNSFSIVETLRSSVVLLIFLLNFRLISNSFRLWNDNQANMFLIFIGIIGAVSTFYTWVQRRGVLELQSERLALDADYYAVVAICISIYASKIRPKKTQRHFEIIMTSFTAVLLLATLSRTYIVVLTTLVALAFLKNTGNRIRQSSRNVIAISIITLLVFVLVNLLNEEQYRILQIRIIDSIALFSNSQIVSSNSYMESIASRKVQGSIARNLWLESPIFGKGAIPSGLTIDSIFGALVKYGIVGSAVIFIIFLTLYQTLNRSIARSSLDLGIATFVFIVLVPSSLIGNWTENKSIWLSLNLVYFLLLVRSYNSSKVR